ncbi:MAG: linear amide C-N hydrolase [Lentimicrobium sp.]|nr:linear amide C-N hydrolase [Lentimicrobium sp.]
MKNLPVGLLFLVLLLNTLPFDTKACTTFFMKDNNGHKIFGRNFDFPSGLGYVEINHRSQVKTAFIAPPEIPFSWISKYGSISFNQIGREFPYGGMNEAGLVVEQMWHQEAKYPEMDDRKALTELQWIQYQLDNASNVNEVIESDSWLRISFTSTAPLHFLVADAEGNAATLEFTNGKMTVHTGSALPYPVLANCSYETSLDYKLKKENGDNESFTTWTEHSSGRFKTAADMIGSWTPEKGQLVDYGFSVLAQVAQGDATQWSIIYDITDMKIYFRTNSNKTIKSLKFADFNYACNEPALRLDINTSQTNSYTTANYADSYSLISEVCNQVEFLKGLPEEVRISTAQFGLGIHCE